MPGLCFLACDRCGTVHAEPEPPSQCAHCRADTLTDITARLGAAEYFYPDTLS